MPGGTVTQLYPNPLQPAPQVQGQTAVLIPDVTQANSFLIQTAGEGMEGAYCAATQQALAGQVSGNLVAAQLEALAQPTSLANVQIALESTGLVVSSAALQWQVGNPGIAVHE